MNKDNYLRGIAEEYPLCCIDFFEHFWSRRSEIGMFSGRPEVYDWHIEGLEYIPCPDCVIKLIGSSS